MAGVLSQPLPRDIREESPSARLIYSALQEADRSLTVNELVARTGAAPATTRRVLSGFRDREIVKSTPHPLDARAKMWSVASQEER